MVPYIFLSCIHRKDNGKWEQTSKGEGKTVKLSIEEIICILEVLRKKSANWRGFHIFKNRKTEINIGWESEAREVLLVKIGEYKKKLRFPNTEFLTHLLEHILKEKIEFATSGTFATAESANERDDEKEYGLFTEQILARDGLQVVETTEYGVESIERIEIEAKIVAESPKALRLRLDTGKEFWVPKSTIHSQYDAKNRASMQNIILDKWIVDKNLFS